MTRPTDEALVADYLARLANAADLLPRAERAELVEQIEAHIRAALAEGGSDEAAVRDVLARLGPPEEVAAAAGAGEAIPTVPAGGPGALEYAAVVLLLVGVVALVVGWVVGVVLLWSSPRWRWPDKLLGTLVWPFGLGLAGWWGLQPGEVCSAGSEVERAGAAARVVAETCSGTPPWLGVLGLVVLIVPPIAVAVHLLRRARGHRPVAAVVRAA